MEPSEIAEEQNAKARECEAQQELDGLAESANAPLSLNELDAVAGGV